MVFMGIKKYMENLIFTDLKNIQRLEGLILKFTASVLINKQPHLIQCSSGGNSIYMHLSNKGTRLCFAKNRLDTKYMQKIKLIEKILPQYVPKIYETGNATVSFSQQFMQELSLFVNQLNLPTWLLEKYNLMRTIKKQNIETVWITTDHLESTGQYDPLHSRIKIDDLKNITMVCLNSGIYMGFVPRLSNVIETKDGIKYLDFDEWVIIDNDKFAQSIIENEID